MLLYGICDFIYSQNCSVAKADCHTNAIPAGFTQAAQAKLPSLLLVHGSRFTCQIVVNISHVGFSSCKRDLSLLLNLLLLFPRVVNVKDTGSARLGCLTTLWCRRASAPSGFNHTYTRMHTQTDRQRANWLHANIMYHAGLTITSTARRAD